MALVTFAIPLRRPNSIADRERLDRILGFTLGSIFQQSHSDFRVLLAAAHTPKLPDCVDGRLELVPVAGVQASSWEEANFDSGHRRSELARRFSELGGGYLMPVDHDDFVHRDLVAHVASTLDPYGYALATGYLFDASQNVLAPYPLKDVRCEAFHKFCGTSLILRLSAQDIPQPYDRAFARGHHHAADIMAEAGRPLAPIPFPAAVYVRNSGGNVSHFATDPGAEGARHWYRELDEQARVQQVRNDEELRRTFAIPASYPAPEPAGYAFAAPQDQPTLSVLVCTYRRPEGLELLLKAAVPQLNAHREIVVVNDGSHDDRYADVAFRYAAHIRYRALKKNLGIAEARNAAARMAANEWLVFTDDDCVPPSHWLDWLAARIAASPELEAVAGSTRALLNGSSGFFAHVRAAHDLIPTTATQSGEIIFPTAIFAVRRAVFDLIGGFGFPDFSGAGEDTEFAMRLARSGIRTYFDPAWFTYHEVAEGILPLCRRYYRYGVANGRLHRLTTSPAAHDYMQNTWRSPWRTVWNWEWSGRLAAARVAHDGFVSVHLSAFLANVVKMAYWKGVKDAFAADVASL